MTDESVVIFCRNIQDDIQQILIEKGLRDGNSDLIKEALDHFNVLKDVENVTLEERITYFKIFVTFKTVAETK